MMSTTLAAAAVAAAAATASTTAAAGTILPTFFLAHGGGPSYLMDGRGSMFADIDKNSAPAKMLGRLRSTLPAPPKALLVISAHWEAEGFEGVAVQTGAAPSLYFDYYGFPPETYKY